MYAGGKQRKLSLTLPVEESDDQYKYKGCLYFSMVCDRREKRNTTLQHAPCQGEQMVVAFNRPDQSKLTSKRLLNRIKRILFHMEFNTAIIYLLTISNAKVLQNHNTLSNVIWILFAPSVSQRLFFQKILDILLVYTGKLPCYPQLTIAVVIENCTIYLVH